MSREENNLKPKPICLICGYTADFLLNKDGYDFYRCISCGLVFVWPIPTSDYLAEEVYSVKSGYQGHKSQDLSVTKLSDKQEKVLAYFLKTKPHGRLLDVGCSNGQFIYWAKRSGLSVAGAELNDRTAAIGRANGLDIFSGTLEQMPQTRFDFILLGDVLEHVPNPRQLLIQCGERLVSDGRLVIVTPNLDAFWPKVTFWLYQVFGIPWSALTPPHHLWQFSFDNLKKFLREKDFVIDRHWFNPPPALAYEFGVTHLWGRAKKRHSFKGWFYTFFALKVYAFFYLLNWFICLFTKSGPAMVLVVKKR